MHSLLTILHYIAQQGIRKVFSAFQTQYLTHANVLLLVLDIVININRNQNLLLLDIVHQN